MQATINLFSELSDDDLALLLANLDQFSPEEQQETEEILNEIQKRKESQACRDDLIEFCKKMQPDYKVGKHHRILADHLMGIANGEKDRICVNIPPRHGKSQLVSIYFPAWFLGKYPDKKVLMVSHTTDLAVGFGRKVRNLIDNPEYKTIFPTVSLAPDNKSAGRWDTNVGGEYYACGVGSALAGRGADLLLVDDPHNEQDIINGNLDIFEKAYEWFTYGARTRLMPGGRVAIIQTRWHQDDLTGRVVKDMTQNEEADQYEVVEFPAILNQGEVNEKALWPEFYNLTALYRTKASMPLFQWNAQFQQNPTGEEAAIIKREWWKIWKPESPPYCEYIIMALDAAAETNNRADYTAITTWGVFLNEETSLYNIILLNAIKKRIEFHELKELALKEYREWNPDSFIVEKKSAGTQLYQELRRIGVMVQEFTPHRGSGDKMARLNAVSDIIKSGLVWVPETRWAEEVMEEIAGFPFMSHDDLVDTTSMALARFRQGGFIRLPSDEPEDIIWFKSKRNKGYY
jgi:predicted phage terminase large subunit-like protein